MAHACRAGTPYAPQRPSARTPHRPHLPIALGLLLASLLVLLVPGRGAFAGGIRAPAGMNSRSTGTTLAVARATGASLYDDAGRVIRELPAGAALKVTGRTSDSRWFYGSTRDGATGWVSADEALVFGARNVPERAGFTEPKAPTAPTPGPAAEPAAAAVRIAVTVKSGAQRLNVRSGPGATYPVVGSVATGAKLTAVGRNAGGDWIRVEGPSLPGGSGWVSAAYLALDGSARDLSVAESPAAAPSAKSPAPIGLAGKLVFQESSGGKIDVYDLATGALRQLTTGADPAVSPDGREVVFWRDTGRQELFVIGIDGRNERRILTRGELLAAPAWSPDGGKIAFSHMIGEKNCRVPAYGYCLPDIFPYNAMYPFFSSKIWGLARVDRNGGSFQDLAAQPSAIAPSWNDRGIFYGSGGIQVTQDVADGDPNRAVAGQARYQDPAAQPGGDRVVFQSLEKDHWEIFTVNADGSGLAALTHPDPLDSRLPHNVSPAWSPDGRSIVFLSDRTGQWRLWVMNADGSNQRVLPVDKPIEYNYGAEQVVSWGK